MNIAKKTAFEATAAAAALKVIAPDAKLLNGDNFNELLNALNDGVLCCIGPPTQQTPVWLFGAQLSAVGPILDASNRCSRAKTVPYSTGWTQGDG